MTAPGIRRNGWKWGALGLLAAGLAVTGYWLLFTTFMLYDDEGYVLLSLRNFSAHGALYDRVYTQYGPVPYLIYDALHRLLGFEFTNVSGRWITLVNWLGAASAGAILVARVTRSLLWSALTLAVTFAYLWIMINEPIHPGGLLALLVAAGTAWSGELWTRGRLRAFAVVGGATAALLALTKINVGVFFLGAAVCWLAANAAPARLARFFLWALAAGCALLPFVLMRSLFDQPWVRMYALVFAGAALSLTLALPRVTQPRVGAPVWTAFAIAFGLVGSGVVALTLARGSSLAGLLHGVLLDPLRHPGVYSFGMNWRVGTGVLAIASLAGAALVARQQAWEHPRFRSLVALVRVVAAAIFLCSPLQLIPTSMAAWGMCYGVTLAWLFVVPLQSNREAAQLRGWLALVLVFQFLQGYPVAGSQINWGTFLWVPLLALGLADAAPVLRSLALMGNGGIRRLAIAAVAGVTLFTAGQLGKIGAERFYSSQPLALPGAESLRLPDDITYDLRIITENLRAHADLLFSFPGIFSANLWSGLRPPTPANATHWFSLLRPAQQQEIVDRLEAAPRAAVLVQRDLLEFLDRQHFSTASPLRDWFVVHFQPVLKIDGYEIWLRRGRTIAPLSTARIGSPASSGEQLEITLTLKAPAAPIARIELCDLAHPRTSRQVFDAGNTRVSVVACDLSGQPQDRTHEAAFPVHLPPVGRLQLHTSAATSGIDWSRALLVLRDVDGRVVAEARVIR